LVYFTGNILFGALLYIILYYFVPWLFKLEYYIELGLKCYNMFVGYIQKIVL